MFQKQIFLTSSRFGALQNFLVAVFFSSAYYQKKNMTKTVLTWRILLPLLPFAF